MKEFIDKLIEKLNDRMEHLDGRHKILTDAGLFKESDKIAYKMVEVDFIKQIVNELAEEYKVSEMPTGSEDYCEWVLIDYEANVYDTTCRNPHILLEGSPTDNSYEFCPYCGKKTKVVE